jgi:tetratricopeptide (TPR) repeat protein
MVPGLPIRIALAGFVLVAVAAGQTSAPQKPADQPCASGSQNSSSSSSDKPCTQSPDTKPPAAAEQFPFPGEPSAPAKSPSDSPDAPAPASTRKSAADEHPFPGEAPPALPGSDSPSSSSSSSSSSDDADKTDKPDVPWADQPASTRSARRKLPKVEKVQTPEDRVAEDLSVAKFYESRGNLNAAYLRTKDAVKTQPDDPDTHFALAQIAQKMQKREEAVAEFNTYLKLDPDGLNIKAARKALSQLQ